MERTMQISCLSPALKFFPPPCTYTFHYPALFYLELEHIPLVFQHRVQPGFIYGLRQFRIASRSMRIQIEPERALEQSGILGNDGDGGTEKLKSDVGNAHAVDDNLSFIGLKDSEQGQT